MVTAMPIAGWLEFKKGKNGSGLYSEMKKKEISLEEAEEKVSYFLIEHR